MTFLPQPALFADFTTEGGANNYLTSSGQVAGFSAWVTGLGATYTRGSAGFFTNSSGLLVSAANNVARFDFDPVALTPRGLLLEGASTNSCLFSQGAFNTQWASNSGFTSITDNAVTAPDGTLTASTFVVANQGARIQQVGGGAISAGATTFSIYAKGAVGGEQVKIGFNNGSDGLVLSPTLTLTTSWARYTFIATTTAANSDPQIESPTATAQTYFLWGFQMELLSFASSYIPTTGSIVTRAADLISIPFAQNSLSAYLNTTGFQVSSNMLLDGGGHNIGYDASVGYISSNTVNQIAENVTVTTTSPHRAASSGAIGIRSLAFDGGNLVSDSNNYTNGSQTTVSVFATNGNFSAAVAQLGYWTQVFSADQLTLITTPGQAITFASGPLVDTTLTRVPARAFTRKRYRDLLDEIREEVRAEREAVGDLDERGRADRDFEVAQRMLNELESNLGPTNYAKTMDAREKLEAARKARDHHYFMEIVNKEWAKHNG